MPRSAIRFATLLASLGSAAGLAAQDRPVESITEQDVRRRIWVIAHDSMGGRATPSRGLNQTAAYIASEFAKFGLEPAGDSGSFVQWYPSRAPVVRDLPIGATLRVSEHPGGDDRAPNVAAILPGADPVLRDEYIVFSAHMDHVGINPSAGADSIFNGADDDASGTAGVLELAEAYSRAGGRPKRSLIFLTVSGEERGLWGSDHFVQNPPVPLGRVVANINMDMIGRNWRDTIAVIGREHSDLGATLARVNAEHPELGMTAIDDIWPQENFYFRSDHYNFAKRGVPVLFFFNGTHADYHGAGDGPEQIDAEKEARLVRLIYHLGLAIGNAPERPKWNDESYRAIVKP